MTAGIYPSDALRFFSSSYDMSVFDDALQNVMLYAEQCKDILLARSLWTGSMQKLYLERELRYGFLSHFHEMPYCVRTNRLRLARRWFLEDGFLFPHILETEALSEMFCNLLQQNQVWTEQLQQCYENMPQRQSYYRLLTECGVTEQERNDKNCLIL